MDMERGSKQDGGVVNMTRAMEALTPWVNNPRKTIIRVEALVATAAALLFLQLILGCCRRRWHNFFIKYGLQASTTVMNPLIIYTLGTMQSSPIKNSAYPVWAAFLIMASAGTTAIRQYDFYDSLFKKCMQVCGEYFRDFFYAMMFYLLADPNTYTWKTAWDLKRRLKNDRSSSGSVMVFVCVILFTKSTESVLLVFLGYKNKSSLFITKKKSRRTQVAEPETGESDSDPQSMKGYKYEVYYRLGRLITIDQIWDYYGNSADDGKALLKDLCLSCALFQRLRERYFGVVYPKTGLFKDHDFVFKKLLPSEGDFKRAFKIIEVELDFCYDFFFTKYHCTFEWMNLPVPFIQYLILPKMIVISIVLVFAIRKSLVLETPNPIIEVSFSEVDYIITVLVLCVALIVELVQTVVYLSSNWAQVSLACMHVKKCCREPSAFIFVKVVGFLRRITTSGALRNKIDQYSVIFRRKQQPDPVEVSDAVKRAIARSFRSIYVNNLTTNGDTTVRPLQDQMFDEYYWALMDLSQLEVMLIWHIATEYCDISADDPSNGNGSTPTSNHRAAHLFGYVLQLLRPDPRRNTIARDSHRGVAVHLSRYCAYLIGSVPELLPFHEADTAELAQEVMEERKDLFGSYYRLAEIYNEMKKLGTEEEDDDHWMMFQKGVKLGKQLERMADGHHWEVLEHFWAKMIIHAAASKTTTKQHMQHLENGGEFLTHIWALLAHAGILG